MDINELATKIRAEIESGNFKIQAVFDRYIGDIESLSNLGITHNKIRELVSPKISLNYYRTMVERARKKKKINKNFSINNIDKIELPKKLEGYDIDFWNDQLGFEINERIFNRLNNLSMSVDIIKDKNFPNAKRLSDFLIESEHKSKYKKL